MVSDDMAYELGKVNIYCFMDQCGLNIITFRPENVLTKLLSFRKQIGRY
jgi:hypothetical protein